MTAAFAFERCEKPEHCPAMNFELLTLNVELRREDLSGVQGPRFKVQSHTFA